MQFTKTNILKIAQAVLALVALLLFFAPALSADVFGKTINLSGFQAWLGGEINVAGIAINAELTFGGVLAVILVIAAIALPVVKLFVKEEVVKFLDFAIMGVAVVAAIFLFCGTTGLMCSFDASGYGLGFGAIIAAILLIVEAVASVLLQFVIKD